MWTWRHSGLRTQEASFLPLCSVFHFENLSEGGRVWHCSCNAFLVSGESPSLPSALLLQTLSLAASPAGLTHPQAGQCLYGGLFSWLKKSKWLTEPKKCWVKMDTEHQHCRSLLYVIVYVQVTRAVAAPARHIVKPTHWGSNTAHKVQRCGAQLCFVPVPVQTFLWKHEKHLIQI